MEEYISKEKTINLIDKMIKSVEHDSFKSGLVIPVLTVAKEIVSELPNENVAPVVHAEWKNMMQENCNNFNKDDEGDKMLYTVKEISEIFKVNEETIRRWIWKGKIKAVKIGRDWRIQAEELEKIKVNA